MDRTSLGKLPVELRLQIYDYVLHTDHETGVLEWDDKGPKLPRWMTANNRQALTTVCKQIRAETFPIFYQCHKVSLRSLNLDKYQPGFFTTEDEGQIHMIWDYLGLPHTWQDQLCSWLYHMGPEVFNNITTVDIHIGTWEKAWVLPENPLMAWLTEALASMVRLFETSPVQVNLCFFLKFIHWCRGGIFGELSLPICDMDASYGILDGFFEEHRSRLGYDAYPSLRREMESLWEGNRQMLRSFLAGLDQKINGKSCERRRLQNG